MSQKKLIRIHKSQSSWGAWSPFSKFWFIFGFDWKYNLWETVGQSFWNKLLLAMPRRGQFKEKGKLQKLGVGEQ